jgi:hypothetical protein
MSSVVHEQLWKFSKHEMGHILAELHKVVLTGFTHLSAVLLEAACSVPGHPPELTGRMLQVNDPRAGQGSCSPRRFSWVLHATCIAVLWFWKLALVHTYTA